MSLTPLPHAERYARFRDSVFAGLEEGPAACLSGLEASMSEMDVQSLWFGGAFGAEFTDPEGRRVRMADFGEWNSGAGPDFTNTAVEVDGQLLRGDIELDMDARDWERHGHGANPEFGRVVLHLFVHAPKERFYTRTHEHRAVAQARLPMENLAGSALPNRGLAAARLGRCHTPLAEMGAARVASLLEAAAQHRLENKSRRIHRCAEAQGRAQTIYQELARTLGYQKNPQPFVLLAQRLPLKRMLKLPPMQREALLFGVAGFMEAVRHEETAGRSREYLSGLWSEWWKHYDEASRWLQPRHLPRWRLSATRPGNHPQRRLGALAAMLASWERVAGPLMDAGRWSRDAWRETMTALRHDHWSAHYTLTSAPAAAPLALVGETRVQEMLANVVYPLLIPERTRLWAEYLDLPALLENSRLRRAVARLFGNSTLKKDFGKKLHHQQGLLQVYEDFCLEDDSGCAGCPFPERLKEWA
ncbi:MAG TPA: DUF2851 family protein [Prosthecobacter sp.]|nr:DUF2851 family protein [Prosthecobacter sp.]HRK13246.1 DUF2851 family protein [Prosthecobacter sp.]